MNKRTYNIGYLSQNVTDNTTDDLTATEDKVLAGNKFVGKDGIKATGTIPTYKGESETASITLKELLDTKKNADYLFYNFKGDTIPINYWDTENVYSMNGMFQNCDVKDIPALNMDNVEYMDNMYNGTTAETINIQQPEPRMFRMARRSLSNIEQFMQEIGKLDEWNDLVWSNIELNENVKSVNGLLNGAQNVQNVKINNNTKKIKKLYASALGNNKSLKNFWVTNCGNIEEGIKNIINKCPNIETLVLENVTTEQIIDDFDDYMVYSPLKHLYMDGLYNLTNLFQGIVGLENIQNAKLLDCINVERAQQVAFYNNALKKFTIGNQHIKNISISEFKKYTQNKIQYTVPYLNFFEPGGIIYSMQYERYYIIKENGTFKRILGSIDDYIKAYNNGQDIAPMLVLNQSMHNRSELLQASLDCFLKGAIIYSNVDNAYYIKDIVSGDWITTEEPSKYPLKQSLFTLKEMTSVCYNCENLESFIIADASEVGNIKKDPSILAGSIASLQSERFRNIQAKGYENNYDLPTNPEKLKYFKPGCVFYWQDNKTYYEIDNNNNAVPINPDVYLSEHDIFPPLQTKILCGVKVNINQSLGFFYKMYLDTQNQKIAFVYDQHSRTFYKLYKIYTVHKPITEISVSNYNDGDFVISNDLLCYKKVANNWLVSNIFYTVPNNTLLGIPQRYGAENFELNTYKNTLFVFLTDSITDYDRVQMWIQDFGVGNVIKDTYLNKLYKIVNVDNEYGIEEVSESYLDNKNIQNIFISSYYNWFNIKASIEFNKVVKNFEIYGVQIDDSKNGLSNDWNDSHNFAGSADNAFFNCKKLKKLILPGMPISFDISASTAFEEEDIITIFNNLAKLKSTQIITLNSKYNNLSNEIKSIALDKGWTIVFR